MFIPPQKVRKRRSSKGPTPKRLELAEERDVTAKLLFVEMMSRLRFVRLRRSHGGK
jgi:hypothetical protein